MEFYTQVIASLQQLITIKNPVRYGFKKIQANSLADTSPSHNNKSTNKRRESKRITPHDRKYIKDKLRPPDGKTKLAEKGGSTKHKDQMIKSKGITTQLSKSKPWKTKYSPVV